MAALLESGEHGLFCVEGGFYVDPWRRVERAVVTHAHSDHATPGCDSYLTSARGEHVLRARMGASAVIETVGYGEARVMGNVRVSLHPAGHILGSSQVRLERVSGSEHGPEGEVLVFSGDYKAHASDATCEAFEPVRCHTFITESTFGLPIYRWEPQESVFEQINRWWRENREAERTSVVYAYALGKAQRLLAGIDASIGPIGVHGSVARLNAAYEAAGVGLPRVLPTTGSSRAELRGRGLVVAPPSVNASMWLRNLGGREGVSTAFASGWMRVRGARRWLNVDRGFVLSDHADWPGLLDAIHATGATRIGVTHGSSDALARYLGESGVDAYTVASRYEGERIEQGKGEAESGEASA
jgi:putative mRNA 3-end processing factor